IRWCAYCQTYQGERAPYDDYSLTHTICDRCAARDSWRKRSAIEAIEPVRRLFRRVASPGPGDEPERLVTQALAMGIEPIDLLLGIVQPVLYEVGARWALGEATVEEEHEVTRRCLAIYEALLERQGDLEALRRREPPEVLLACAPGNTHT